MADRPLFARTVGSVGLTLPPATLGALASAVLLIERSQVTGPIWFFSPNDHQLHGKGAPPELYAAHCEAGRRCGSEESVAVAAAATSSPRAVES